jgi:hypothetical protein
MIRTKKINDIKVCPIKLPKLEADKIRGYDLFPEIYANIYLSARKKSGKTCTINHILKKCADKRTHVVVFCSTFNKDANWKAIRQTLDKKEIPNEFHLGIVDESGVNHLDELLTTMREDVSDSEDSETESEEEAQILSFGTTEVEVKVRKPRKPKFISPKYIIIMDDLSMELKNPSIAHLLKTNRHYKCKVILSSQYLNDIQPMSRRQIDYYILFGGMSLPKLQELYNNADLSVSFDDFVALYNQATEAKYNFLYVDSVCSTFRKNFDHQFVTEG